MTQMKTKEQIMQHLEKIKLDINEQLLETCNEKEMLTNMKDKVPSMIYLVNFQITYLMQEVEKVIVALKFLQNDDTASLENAIAVLSNKNMLQNTINSLAVKH